MLSRQNYFARQEGLTLVEVMVCLVILGLLAVSWVNIFGASSIWIKTAGQETIARDYAATTLEVIKAYSSDLVQLPLSEGDFTISDSDNTDDLFSFTLDPARAPLQVKAPPNMTAAINIRPYEDAHYYDQNHDGVRDFEKYFDHNLLTVNVNIVWEENGKEKNLKMSTIIGAR